MFLPIPHDVSTVPKPGASLFFPVVVADSQLNSVQLQLCTLNEPVSTTLGQRLVPVDETGGDPGEAHATTLRSFLSVPGSFSPVDVHVSSLPGSALPAPVLATNTCVRLFIGGFVPHANFFAQNHVLKTTEFGLLGQYVREYQELLCMEGRCKLEFDGMEYGIHRQSRRTQAGREVGDFYLHSLFQDGYDWDNHYWVDVILGSNVVVPVITSTHYPQYDHNPPLVQPTKA